MWRCLQQLDDKISAKTPNCGRSTDKSKKSSIKMGTDPLVRRSLLRHRILNNFDTMLQLAILAEELVQRVSRQLERFFY